MDELVEMYKLTSRRDPSGVDKKILKKNNLSETQWSTFMHLAEDLELNEMGVRIMLEEIKSGRMKLG